MPSEQSGQQDIIAGSEGAAFPVPSHPLATPASESRQEPDDVAIVASAISRASRISPELADAEQASQAMLRGSLDTLIRLIERVSPGMRGSVLLLDEDGVTLHHGAAPRLPRSYCDAIDGASIGPAAGSCGTAAYRRERVIVRDIATDPLWEDYRDLASTYGLAACWSTPIMDRGNVLGTFAMYYTEPRAPTEADISLTDTAAMLAGNAIKRARAERALRVSEARFRSMAEAIPVQVWTARPDGHLDYITQKVADYLGRTKSELLGAGWSQFIHPDDLKRVAARWNHSIETGEPYEIEFRVFSVADGEYRWHLVRANPMLDADGRVVQWFGCNAEIEEHKRLELARDAALEQVNRANKSKADFLAMMSHELRTPLNAIGGYAQLMIDGIPTPPSEGQLNYLRRIAKSQHHLLGLIEAVLLHAKVEAGKVTYQIADFWARDVLDLIDPLTAPQRAAKRLGYDCSGCDGKLVFRGDREKVVQILVNVLSNAAKFTPADGHISVATEVLSPGVGAFVVKDTGIGMSGDELQVVFEPYVQFDSALARESKGTGLGMPISRELARGMGGDLTATSERGVGSVFTLSLPLAGV
ncbi:MAG TPA: ATP-binding protein [Gemmatimonadaceae bacterium]|nr:ATP-binding protein [Gemmatimonadaceae bacterium]